MSDELKRAQLRAVQYQHVDGSFELTFGGAVFLMAITFYGVSWITPADTFFARNILPFAPLAVFVGAGFLLDALIKRLRMRVTIPRSGYITYQKPQPLKRSTRLVIWIGIPVLTVILETVLFLNRTKFQTGSQESVSFLMPVFLGLLLSGLWVIVGWKIAISRFYLIAVISLLVSGGLFFNGVGSNTGMAVLLGAMGSALCVSGGVTLWRYMRNNHLPEDNSPAT